MFLFLYLNHTSLVNLDRYYLTIYLGFCTEPLSSHQNIQTFTISSSSNFFINLSEAERLGEHNTIQRVIYLTDTTQVGFLYMIQVFLVFLAEQYHEVDLNYQEYVFLHMIL